MTRTMCIAAMCMLLGGCGETAYKVGGNTDDYRIAQKSCRDDGGDQFAYKACMKQKGWTIVGIEGSVAGTPAEAMQPTPIAGTDTSAGALAPVTPIKPASASVTPATGETEHATPQKAPPAPAKAASTTADHSALDPNEVVTVQSWWKFGTADFKGDVQACETLLGGNHRYDEVKKTATRAVIGCMRAKGWRAY